MNFHKEIRRPKALRHFILLGVLLSGCNVS
jgi:hypothetical protein